MLSYKSIVRIMPRRFMASGVPSNSDGDGNKTKGAIEKSSQQAEDEHEELFSGQTKINYNHDGVGFKQSPASKDTFFNPLLTPPPRSPRTPEDFSNPSRLGHWISLGYSYTSPTTDRYHYHEIFFFFMFGLIGGPLALFYAPDMKSMDWARREAFLRLAKREALGLPLIDKNVVDPDRIVLPTEEELEDYLVSM